MYSLRKTKSNVVELIDSTLSSINDILGNEIISFHVKNGVIGTYTYVLVHEITLLLRFIQ